MTDRDEDLQGRLEPGTIIDGRYRIAHFIGRGGSGTIYGAEVVHTGEGVAIKTLNADLISHPSAVARYQREARSAAAIGHPNICAVLDAGQLKDRRPYLVMELLSGKTLADRIREEGALPLSQVLTVLAQTLSALEAAHAQRIVHRDIKPDNVFLTDRIQGVLAVKLLDFGIAKSLDENAELSLTRTGMVVGTPFYMAPEQARGEKLDHRVDLYACGVLLYEMLTGRRPFHATNYNALMMQVLTKKPPDPRHLRPKIPSDFVDVMLKAMHKRPDRRYTDARAFLSAVWGLEGVVHEALAPAEVGTIAAAVQVRRGAEGPARDSNGFDDIPVYHDSEPPAPLPPSRPPRVAPPRSEDSEVATRPFLRPEQLPSIRKHPSSNRDSFSDATEVMVDAPWLEHDKGDDDAVDESERPTEVESSSWDDEPTRVEPPPFMGSREPRSPLPAAGRPPPKRNKPSTIPKYDPPPKSAPRPQAPPKRVPRPKRKG